MSDVSADIPEKDVSQQVDGSPSSEDGSPGPAASPSEASRLRRSSLKRSESAEDSDRAGDASSGAAPYSTRSRRAGAGPRVNYADEEGDLLDAQLAKATKDNTYGQNPGNLDGSARNADDPGKSSSHIIRLSTGGGGFSAVNGASGSQSSSSRATPDAPSEKKKRKIERANGEKARISLGSKEDIPGMSQFSAAPNGTSDQPPPTKKRKTGDGLSKSGPSPATGHSASRKLSASSYAKRGTHHQDGAIITFDKSGAILKDGKLHADDGTVYAVDDTVYLICEPPGDPYYLCRIMEFRRADPDNPKSPVQSMLVNWFYRPKDIGRYSRDARYVFASMQSDESPLHSLRGKCSIKHTCEIKNVEEFRKGRDTFYFNQLYDRYIHRPYEIIPSSTVINVPAPVKRALDERWKFLVVEPARKKELTSAIKNCKRCGEYCAPDDSVDCGVCHNTYHMACVRPPLFKKPSRGFAWSCGPCSRAQERKLEARHTSVIGDEHDDVHDDEEDEAGAVTKAPEAPKTTQPQGEELMGSKVDIAQAEMWPWRYLGIHCKVEDVLQYDDRAIYPRASSRLGTRHQAMTLPWYGRPVELVKPLDLKKKTKKEIKQSKEYQAALETEKAERANRPKWVQDEPTGYIARGEDLDNSDPNCTATRLFVMPDEDQTKRKATGFATANKSEAPDEQFVDAYVQQVKDLAASSNWNVLTISKKGDKQISTNYLDQALRLLYDHNFDKDKAVAELSRKHDKKTIKDPDLTKEEVKRFEDAVAKHGSDLRLIRKHVKSRTHGEIVRFYYTWKFTERGDLIWGNFSGRRGRRRAENSWTEIADDEDDSAFDNDKAGSHKRRFCCHFCSTQSSRQWRRAPVAPGLTTLADPKASAKDKSNQLVVALCQRCAILWRKYGVRWEDPEEVAKILLQVGGRQASKKQDEELLREMVYANELARIPSSANVAQAAINLGINVATPPESKKKKQSDKEDTPGLTTDKGKAKGAVAPQRPPTPPVVPDQPKLRQLPCAVCRWDDPVGQLITCKECRLSVHRHCFAIPEQTNPNKWICETCVNDKNQLLSFHYKCALCPVSDREVDLIELPKPVYRKKTDRDREKEKMEKELGAELLSNYIREQRSKGKPAYPREALKPTASNNWMHVTCAVFTPEIKFSDAQKMSVAEGMGAALASPGRADPVCKICKVVDGTVVGCHQCDASFHVACAHNAGYTFGIDIVPVKGTRKDMSQIITVGAETGAATAAIWCKEHSIKNQYHHINEVVDENGTTALERYVLAYKQADLTLTGTARKANLLSQTTKSGSSSKDTGANIRRQSVLTNGSGFKASKTAGGDVEMTDVGIDDTEDSKGPCDTCGISTSIRWHLLNKSAVQEGPRHLNGMNGYPSLIERKPALWQCHKCFERARLGIKPVEVEPEVKARDESLSGPPPQPDFFALTARPAPPSFLPLGGLQGPGYPGGPMYPYSGTGPPAPSFAAGFPMQNGGSATPLTPHSVERFALNLQNTMITIVNRNNQSFILRGADLKLELDNDPTPAFVHVRNLAASNLGFDPQRHVFVADEGSPIFNPSTLIQTLVKLAISGRKSAKWTITDSAEAPGMPYGFAAGRGPPHTPTGPAPPPLHTGMPHHPVSRQGSISIPYAGGQGPPPPPTPGHQGRLSFGGPPGPPGPPQNAPMMPAGPSPTRAFFPPPPHGSPQAPPPGPIHPVGSPASARPPPYVNYPIPSKAERSPYFSPSPMQAHPPPLHHQGGPPLPLAHGQSPTTAVPPAASPVQTASSPIVQPGGVPAPGPAQAPKPGEQHPTVQAGREPTVPTPGGTIGASSSPNIRNLMH